MKTQLKLNLRLILIYIILSSFMACNTKDGFLDTLDLGNITVDELVEKVKDKNDIEIKTYKNVDLGENFNIKLKEGEINNDACNCETIDDIETFDPAIANYKGIVGDVARLTAFDNKIVEYEIEIHGVKNINRLLDIVYAEHPDIKVINDGTSRLKKQLDKNTVLEVCVNTIMQNNLHVTVICTSNVEASRLNIFRDSFWLLFDKKDKIIENVSRISLEKGKNGHYRVKEHYN